MGGTIFAIILFLLGIIGFFIARKLIKGGEPDPDSYKDDYSYRAAMKGWEEDRTAFVIGKWVAFAVAMVGLLVLGLNSFTIVPPRNVAVETQFGRPVDTLDNGFHLIAPWASVETFDAAVQTLRLSDDKDDNGEPITVRLANASTATVDVTVQWQIDPHADIMPLYLDFRHFDSIDVNVVRRQLASALNDVFATYDPLAAMKSGEKTETTGHLSSTALAELERSMPAGVKIRSLLIPKIHFDGAVQDKINQYLSAIAETQIAEQQKATALARQQANALLQQGGNLSPEVLYQNCLDMTERMLKEGKNFPIGWACGGSALNMTIPVK